MRPNTLPQLRILIVDDEDMVRDTLKLLLQFDNHLVEEASNVSRALDLFQSGQFDIVITGYDMAGIRGDQLAAAIKALVPSQPVVMLTAYTQAIHNNPGLLKNLDGLISKPFPIETLREDIARALAAKRPPSSSPNP
jgi:CheY-like chemotaxis protein